MNKLKALKRSYFLKPTIERRQNNQTSSEITSRMLGMMSFSHCLRKESLSKVGSAFTISVSTSDISVFEKRPPEDKRNSYVSTRKQNYCYTQRNYWRYQYNV